MIPDPALRPLFFDVLAEPSHLGPQAVELARGLGQAHEALGAHGADMPVEGTLEQVGRARFEGGLGLALSGAEGEDGDSRPGGLVAEDLAEAAAALVAERHVGEDDDRAVAAELIDRGGGTGRGDHLEPGAGEPPGRALLRRAVGAGDERDASPVRGAYRPAGRVGAERRNRG